MTMRRALLVLLLGMTAVAVEEEETAAAAALERYDYPAVKLRDGTIMPQIGVGLGGSSVNSDDDALQTTKWVLELGARLVDTASSYGNEKQVVKAMQELQLNRSEVFISSKLDEEDHGYEEAYDVLQWALADQEEGPLFGAEYLDLFLIHKPISKIVETWDAFVDLQEDGLVKSIGVSNFGIPHLEAIRNAPVADNQPMRPMPVINQIQMHPFIYNRQKDLVQYCKEHGIRIMAYESMLGGRKEFYEHPVLQTISKAHNRTVPQVLLRWALDHGFVIILASASSKERLRSNYDILDFQLTKKELQQMDDLGTKLKDTDKTFTFEKLDKLTHYWATEDMPVDTGDVFLAARLRALEKSQDRALEEAQVQALEKGDVDTEL